MPFVQQARAQRSSALLLHLPEEYPCPHLGCGLPNIRSQWRIQASEFRFQPGLPSRRVHVTSGKIRLQRADPLFTRQR
jgi:hypothetical protein